MSAQKLRIAFMGTPDFAVPALQILCDSGHDVVCIYTQQPRARGRGQQVQRSPIHEFADKRGIEVRTPENFADESDIAAFKALNLDLAVVAAYGMLLPEVILNAPRHGCVNIHPSLLPRWRGTSPVQFAILKGDQETGVSLMKLVRKMDAGPVIAQTKIIIPPRATYGTLNKQLWALGSAMLGEMVSKLSKDGAFATRAQDESGATYTKMLNKEDGRVDWTRSAEEIDRQIRALSPWPGVWSAMKNKRVKILEALPAAQSTDATPGTILNTKGSTACGGSTVLQIIKIQPENARAMDFVAAANGGYLHKDSRFQ